MSDSGDARGRGDGRDGAAKRGPLSFVAALIAKDLLVESRSREVVYTMTFFAAMIVLLFSFAFDGEGADEKGLTAGMIWISVIFSGTIGLGRAFDRERESDTMRALLMAPIPRASIFFGKAASVAVFMLVVELVVVGLAGLLFGSAILGHPLHLAATLLLGTIGVAVVGSMFAGMLLRSRARDVLLPVVLYPILVPLFMAVTFSTNAILMPDIPVSVAEFWIKFATVYDAVFAVAGFWMYELVVIE